jgi:ADP-ribose pyrophosphatase YjhB (NUDIX family)
MNVRVGVGCFVRHPTNVGTFLIGRRKGSHGGMMALPGGHLEVNNILIVRTT